MEVKKMSNYRTIEEQKRMGIKRPRTVAQQKATRERGLKQMRAGKDTDTTKGIVTVAAILGTAALAYAVVKAAWAGKMPIPEAIPDAGKVATEAAEVIVDGFKTTTRKVTTLLDGAKEDLRTGSQVDEATGIIYNKVADMTGAVDKLLDVAATLKADTAAQDLGTIASGLSDRAREAAYTIETNRAALTDYVDRRFR